GAIGGGALLAVAGRVWAQSETPPVTLPPPVIEPSDDPIGDVIDNPAGTPVEEAPPAPEEVPATAPERAAPPAKAISPAAEDDESRTEDAGERQVADVTRRPRHQIAVIQALDKITAESIRFEARVGRPVRYKSLVVTVRACETTTGEEAMRDSAAYLEVESQPRGGAAGRQVFRGWMYAQNPAISGLQHPVYDAWVIGCKDAPADIRR
ncbi:MAG TPA: DUF2155 domain-containing protein, partial [Caulobacteraceae bacterium]